MVASFCQSQSTDYQFQLYGVENGLTHRNVFKIQQDTLGFIWLATIDGLNRFDGHVFQHFTADNPQWKIPDDFVSDFILDQQHRLVLSTGKDLAFLDLATHQIQSITTHPEASGHGLDRKFYNLLQSPDGQIFTSTYLIKEGETWLQTVVNNQLVDVYQAGGEYPQHPMVYFDGKMYYGSRENELDCYVFRINTAPQVDSVQTFSFDFPAGETPAFSRVVALQEINDYLYTLLDNGQVYYKRKGETAFQKHPITNAIYKTGSSTTLLVRENGDVWIGGLNTLYFYEARTSYTTNFNQELGEVFPHEATFRQIFEDQTGVLWIATDFGALTISESTDLFQNYLSEGNEFCRNGFCSTRGITEDEEGNIYVSYYNSIHKIEAATDRVLPLFNKKQNLEFPYALLYFEGALYTGDGLRIDLKDNTVTQLLPNISCNEGLNLLDTNKHIWFACGNRLFRHDPQNNITVEFTDSIPALNEFSVETITQLHQHSKTGHVFLGTLKNGLLHFDQNWQLIRHHHTQSIATHRLESNRIINIRSDQNDKIWLATDMGVHAVDWSNGRVNSWQTQDGLPNNFINSLEVENDSVVWISTDNGLSRMSVNSEVFSNFYKKDGLSSNEFNRISSYRSKNGRLYFGGLNGINAFYSNDYFFKENQYKPSAKLIFTGFSKYDSDKGILITQNKSFRQPDTLIMNPNDEFFIFNFSLADYANPHTRLYSYQLDGYETDWSPPAKENFARYNNIPAGDYTFRVRAAIGDGNWTEDELQVVVQVQEAFYRKPWFMLTLVMLLLSGVYGFARLRIYRLKKIERDLEEQVAMRTAQLTDEKQKSDELLLNILPSEIAAELKQNGKIKARRHEKVTVLFSDFQGFMRIAGRMEPEELVREVDYCFRAFDEIIGMYELEKIKTIGDAYMCIGGISGNENDAPVRMVKAALEIQSFLKAVAFERGLQGQPFFEARIGIHTGPVVAGIVGIKKFAYDIWGDTVNIAARMEQTGEVGQVNLSETTYQLVKKYFHCSPRGKVAVKNKGDVDMYFVEGLRR